MQAIASGIWRSADRIGRRLRSNFQRLVCRDRIVRSAKLMTCGVVLSVVILGLSTPNGFVFSDDDVRLAMQEAAMLDSLGFLRPAVSVMAARKKR